MPGFMLGPSGVRDACGGCASNSFRDFAIACAVSPAAL